MKLKAKLITAALVLLGTIVLSGCDYQINPRHHPGYPYYINGPYNHQIGRDFEAAMGNTVWKETSTNGTIYINPSNQGFFLNGIPKGTYYKHCYETYYRLQVLVNGHALVFDLSDVYREEGNLGHELRVTYGDKIYVFYPSGTVKF